MWTWGHHLPHLWLAAQVGGKDCLVVLSNSGKLTVVLYAHNRFQALTRIHLSDAGAPGVACFVV